MKITYEEARADHEYLWEIAPAYDMTGAYVDQEDLAKLLKNPTKATAKRCYIDQINYWFDAGPDTSLTGWKKDLAVKEIAIRYDREPEYERLLHG